MLYARLVLSPYAHARILNIETSAALAIPDRRIRVESVPIGGGFGGKEVLIEPLVAAVASRLRKPVRLVYTRQEDLLAGNPAPQTVMTVKLGAKRDRTLTAIQVMKFGRPLQY
jgi:CO/xanthine dehydrogenase Mo-binding subunit